ncbi:hypothetical protein Poly30_06760 [Planctomycetes bacterium Poly30]|uniref:Uncharacterized protein n=1 Tax=Saltatorellus ferox TaxID=2528018 RepID=A0A518EM69_9BACT|nr:hypothetical protein Poly30_06760 [Planctomycetes bacterium Poly30]
MESHGVGDLPRLITRLLILLLFALLQVAIPARLHGEGGGLDLDSGAGCSCCAVADAGCGGCCGGSGDEGSHGDGGACLCGEVPLTGPCVALLVSGVPELEREIVAGAWVLAAPGFQVLHDADLRVVEGLAHVRVRARAPDPPPRVLIDFTRVYRI